MGCFRGAPDTSLVSDVRLRLATFGIVLWIGAASSLRFLGCAICDGREAWFRFVWEGVAWCVGVGVGVGVGVSAARHADDARGGVTVAGCPTRCCSECGIYMFSKQKHLPIV
jgi:hypothetical protein